MSLFPGQTTRDPDDAPVSANQRQLWIVDQLYPGTSAYHIPICLRLTGPVRLAAMNHALQEVVARHGSLRTTFHLQDDVPVQRVAPSLTVRVLLQDLTEFGRDAEAQGYAFACAEVQRPFDLSNGPLLRVALIRLSPQNHILVVTMHHIISDGWSAEIFIQELAQCYVASSANARAMLEPLPMQYTDFATLQRYLMAAGRMEEQLRFWKQTLAGAPELHGIPLDKPRPERPGFAGASQTIELDHELVSGLQQFANDHRVTFFMMSAAVFQVLIWTYGTRKDVLIGVPVSGRTIVETEPLIGLFVNTVVLRTTVMESQQFVQLLSQVRDRLLDALSNQSVPFDLVVEAVQARRSPTHNPLFQIMFATFRAAVRSRSFGDLTAVPFVIECQASRFDLSVNIIEGIENTWWVHAEYSTELFEHARISHLLEMYVLLLRGTLADGHVSLVDLRDMVRRAPYSRSSASGNGSRTSRSPHLPISPAKPFRLDPEQELAKAKSTASIHDLEQALVPIWQKHLRVSPVQVHDDFFDLGGNSLLAIQLVADVNRTFRKRIAVSTLFRDLTIHKMAERLSEENPFRASFFPIASMGNKIPIFVGGSQRYFKDLSRALGPDQPFYQMDIYALQEERLLAKQPLLMTVEEMATSFIKDILSVQPRGPYLLAGQCEGGILVLEITRQLQFRGQKIKALFQFDTPVSGYLSIPPWHHRLAKSILRGQFVSKTIRWSVARVKILLGLTKTDAAEKLIWSVIWQAIRDYRGYAVVPAQITLFRAIELTLVRGDIADGWKEIGPTTVIDVPGDHISFFLNPEAQSIVRRSLEAVQDRIRLDRGNM
jgi:thioesterase domain-containing protein